jgi:S-adenosylmethionine:tRNA ribosyltransferase-isomerase
MLISDFDYHLPEELIAQAPLENREGSRMLILDRQTGQLEDRYFFDLPAFLRPCDVLVLNNTKVFPARLFGSLDTGAKIEIFLVRETEGGVWETLARPARRLKPGKKVRFGENLTAEVLDRSVDGKVIVRFEADGDFDGLLDEVGKTPLPPYIKRRM